MKSGEPPFAQLPMTPDSDIATALGIRPGLRAWIGGHQREARAAVERVLRDALRPNAGAIDLLVVSPQTVEEARYFIAKHLPKLTEDGRLWIATDVSSGLGSTDAFPGTVNEAALIPGGEVELPAGYRVFQFRRAPAQSQPDESRENRREPN